MSSNIPEYADVQSLDSFPKVLAYNARNWPKEVAMREKVNCPSFELRLLLDFGS